MLRTRVHAGQHDIMAHDHLLNDAQVDLKEREVMLQSARMASAVLTVVVVVVLDAGSADSKRVDVLSGRTCAHAHEMRS